MTRRRRSFPGSGDRALRANLPRGRAPDLRIRFTSASLLSFKSLSIVRGSEKSFKSFRAFPEKARTVHVERTLHTRAALVNYTIPNCRIVFLLFSAAGGHTYSRFACWTKILITGNSFTRPGRVIKYAWPDRRHDSAS